VAGCCVYCHEWSADVQDDNLDPLIPAVSIKIILHASVRWRRHLSPKRLPRPVALHCGRSREHISWGVFVLPSGGGEGFKSQSVSDVCTLCRKQREAYSLCAQ